MTASVQATSSPEPVSMEEAAGALVGRVFEATLGVIELQTVWLGLKLDFHRHLAEPRTSTELSDATGVIERYTREWLEQQAIAGLLEAGEDRDPATRRYHLSAAQRAVFLDADSPFYGGAMALLCGGFGEASPRVLHAWRTGTGVPFGDYGDDFRAGQGLFNKGGFLGPMVTDWLPGIPVVEALLRGPGARALDVGCGVGWSSIALARAYPGLTVVGIDSDEASVMDARANAVEAGVADRIRFEVRSGQEPLTGAYDVAFYFECLHDMGQPVAALRATRSALREGGVVLVMDEKAEEEFAANGSPVERVLAASSVLHCLPVGLSEPASAATGAMFRPATMRAYAASAGFAKTDVVPIEHDMMRFYLLA